MARRGAIGSARIGPTLVALGIGIAAARATAVGAAPARPVVNTASNPESAPVAIPDQLRSVRVVRGDEPIWSAPRGEGELEATRRGAATIGKLLPVYAARKTSSCQAPFYQVGPRAWICGEGIEPSPFPAPPRELVEPPPETGLPYDYFFVNDLGSLGYRELEAADFGAPAAELEPGFAVAVVRTATGPSGETYGLTSHALWVPLRDLRAARPSRFHGETLDGALDVAWVVTPELRTASRPGGPRGTAPFRYHQALTVLDRADVHGVSWLRVIPRDDARVETEPQRAAGRSAAVPPPARETTDDGAWVRASDVAETLPAIAPENLELNERWIDVDLHEQVLTAYEETRPVFATLVSSGRGRGEAEDATPLGEHRIWVKLVASDMDNLESDEASRYYAMQSVPWVMYFHRGYGLHGAFWHDDFGRRRSHGCVNLSPRDAARLFPWVRPVAPPGWSAILSTPKQGTLIRIRSTERAAR